MTHRRRPVVTQVLRSHKCRTFNALVRSARNEEPLHVTSKVLDLSDWLAPRKVEGVGECRARRAPQPR